MTSKELVKKWVKSLSDKDLKQLGNWFDRSPNAVFDVLEVMAKEHKKRGLKW